MFNKIKRWYRENSIPFLALFFVSAALGLVLTALCFFLPPVLPAVAALVIGGGLPFSFLLSCSLPIASLTLGLMSTGFSWISLALSWFITHQLWTISKALYALCIPEEELVAGPEIKSTHAYISDHLQKKKPLLFCEEDEDDDVAINVEELNQGIDEEDALPDPEEEDSRRSLSLS